MGKKGLRPDLNQNEPINKVIHTPARLRIITTLYVLEGGDMVFLKKETGLTWGNLSVQVYKLEDAGFLEVKKEFVDNKPHTVVNITEPGRTAFDRYRRDLKQLLG